MSQQNLNETIAYICHNKDNSSLGTCVEFWETHGGGSYQWYAIHIVALSVIICTMIGSLSIIVMTLLESRKGPLTSFQKFPMWISICDFSFGCFHGGDHLISLIRGRVMDGGICTFFGWGTIYTMNLPAFWVSAISLCIHTVVVRKKRLMVGTGDWILHVFAWGVPLLYGFFGFIDRDYGQEPMWCGTPKRLWVFNGVFVLIAMLLNTVVYGHISYYLYTYISQRKATKNEIGWVSIHPINKEGEISPETSPEISPGTNKSQPDESSSLPAAKKQEVVSTDEKLMKMAKQMPIYVLIYIIVWLPYFIYTIWLLIAPPTPFVLNLIVVTLTNSGGIFNALAYRHYLLKTRSSSRSKPSTLNSHT